VTAESSFLGTGLQQLNF